MGNSPVHDNGRDSRGSSLTLHKADGVARNVNRLSWSRAWGRRRPNLVRDILVEEGIESHELLTGADFRKVLLHGRMKDAREAVGDVVEARCNGVAAPERPGFDLERRPDRHLRVGAPPVPEEMVAQLALLCHLLLRPCIAC